MAKDFTNIVTGLVSAAENAAKTAFEKYGDSHCCGSAVLVFDGRSAFIKWCRAQGLDAPQEGKIWAHGVTQGYWVNPLIQSKYQSLHIAEAAALAARKFLADNDIPCYIHTWVD